MFKSRKRKVSPDKLSEEIKKTKTITTALEAVDKDSSNAEAKFKLARLLPEGYRSIILTALIKPVEDVEGSEGLVGSLRLAVTTKEDAMIWIKKFEKKTCTIYKTNKTWKELKTGLIKKKYLCHYPYKNDDQNSISTCTGSVTLNLMSNSKAESSPKAYPGEYPCQVIIHFTHNHNIDSEEYCKIVGPKADLRITFYTYFARGHSPFSALICHKCDLHSLHGCDFYKEVANTAVCPLYSWCFREYERFFMHRFIEPIESVLEEELKRIVTQFNTKCQNECATILNNPNFVLSVCTPLMKSIFRSGFGEDLVTVRCFLSPKSSPKRQKVLLFLCHTPVGCLPLGTVVTFADDMDTICAGIQSIINMSGISDYYPKIIITDENALLSKCLRKCFSKSQILFNDFQMLQSIWRIIRVVCTDNEEFQALYNLFLVTMNSGSEEEFKKNFDNLVIYSEKYPKMANFIKYFQARSSSYVLYARPKVEYNTDVLNYTDSGTIILQDVCVKYGSVFNLVQLFDFLINNITQHYERKINKIIKGDQKGFFKTNFYVPLNRIADFTFEKISDTEFQVSLREMTFFVNTELDTCTCQVGFQGGSCVHQYIIEKNLGLFPECFTPLEQDILQVFNNILMGTNVKEQVQRQESKSEITIALPPSNSDFKSSSTETVDFSDMSSVCFSDISNFSGTPNEEEQIETIEEILLDQQDVNEDSTEASGIISPLICDINDDIEQILDDSEQYNEESCELEPYEPNLSKEDERHSTEKSNKTEKRVDVEILPINSETAILQEIILPSQPRENAVFNQNKSDETSVHSTLESRDIESTSHLHFPIGSSLTDSGTDSDVGLTTEVVYTYSNKQKSNVQIVESGTQEVVAETVEIAEFLTNLPSSAGSNGLQHQSNQSSVSDEHEELEVTTEKSVTEDFTPQECHKEVDSFIVDIKSDPSYLEIKTPRNSSLEETCNNKLDEIVPIEEAVVSIENIETTEITHVENDGIFETVISVDALDSGNDNIIEINGQFFETIPLQIVKDASHNIIEINDNIFGNSIQNENIQETDKSTASIQNINTSKNIIKIDGKMYETVNPLQCAELVEKSEMEAATFDESLKSNVLIVSNDEFFETYEVIDDNVLSNDVETKQMSKDEEESTVVEQEKVDVSNNKTSDIKETHFITDSSYEENNLIMISPNDIFDDDQKSRALAETQKSSPRKSINVLSSVVIKPPSFGSSIKHDKTSSSLKSCKDKVDKTIFVQDMSVSEPRKIVLPKITKNVIGKTDTQIKYKNYAEGKYTNNQNNVPVNIVLKKNDALRISKSKSGNTTTLKDSDVIKLYCNQTGNDTTIFQPKRSDQSLPVSKSTSVKNQIGDSEIKVVCIPKSKSVLENPKQVPSQCLSDGDLFPKKSVEIKQSPTDKLLVKTAVSNKCSLQKLPTKALGENIRLQPTLSAQSMPKSNLSNKEISKESFEKITLQDKSNIKYSGVNQELLKPTGLEMISLKNIQIKKLSPKGGVKETTQKQVIPKSTLNSSTEFSAKRTMDVKAASFKKYITEAPGKSNLNLKDPLLKENFQRTSQKQNFPKNIILKDSLTDSFKKTTQKQNVSKQVIFKDLIPEKSPTKVAYLKRNPISKDPSKISERLVDAKITEKEYLPDVNILDYSSDENFSDLEEVCSDILSSEELESEQDFDSDNLQIEDNINLEKTLYDVYPPRKTILNQKTPSGVFDPKLFFSTKKQKQTSSAKNLVKHENILRASQSNTRIAPISKQSLKDRVYQNVSFKNSLPKEKPRIKGNISNLLSDQNVLTNLCMQSDNEQLQMKLTITFAKLRELLDQKQYKTPVETFLTKFKDLALSDKLIFALENFGSGESSCIKEVDLNKERNQQKIKNIKTHTQQISGGQPVLPVNSPLKKCDYSKSGNNKPKCKNKKNNSKIRSKLDHFSSETDEFSNSIHEDDGGRIMSLSEKSKNFTKKVHRTTEVLHKRNTRARFKQKSSQCDTKNRSKDASRTERNYIFINSTDEEMSDVNEDNDKGIVYFKEKSEPLRKSDQKKSIEKLGDNMLGKKFISSNNVKNVIDKSVVDSKKNAEKIDTKSSKKPKCKTSSRFNPTDSSTPSKLHMSSEEIDKYIIPLSDPIDSLQLPVPSPKNKVDKISKVKKKQNEFDGSNIFLPNSEKIIEKSKELIDKKKKAIEDLHNILTSNEDINLFDSEVSKINKYDNKENKSENLSQLQGTNEDLSYFFNDPKFETVIEDDDVPYTCSNDLSDETTINKSKLETEENVNDSVKFQESHLRGKLNKVINSTPAKVNKLNTISESKILPTSKTKVKQEKTEATLERNKHRPNSEKGGLKTGSKDLSLKIIKPDSPKDKQEPVYMNVLSKKTKGVHQYKEKTKREMVLSNDIKRKLRFSKSRRVKTISKNNSAPKNFKKGKILENTYSLKAASSTKNKDSVMANETTQLKMAERSLKKSNEKSRTIETGSTSSSDSKYSSTEPALNSNEEIKKSSPLQNSRSKNKECRQALTNQDHSVSIERVTTKINIQDIEDSISATRLDKGNLSQICLTAPGSSVDTEPQDRSIATSVSFAKTLDYEAAFKTFLEKSQQSREQIELRLSQSDWQADLYHIKFREDPTEIARFIKPVHVIRSTKPKSKFNRSTSEEHEAVLQNDKTEAMCQDGSDTKSIECPVEKEVDCKSSVIQRKTLSKAKRLSEIGKTRYLYKNTRKFNHRRPVIPITKSNAVNAKSQIDKGQTGSFRICFKNLAVRILRSKTIDSMCLELKRRNMLRSKEGKRTGYKELLQNASLRKHFDM